MGGFVSENECEFMTSWLEIEQRTVLTRRTEDKDAKVKHARRILYRVVFLPGLSHNRPRMGAPRRNR